jgi:hypothetical protein
LWPTRDLRFLLGSGLVVAQVPAARLLRGDTCLP